MVATKNSEASDLGQRLVNDSSNRFILRKGCSSLQSSWFGLLLYCTACMDSLSEAPSKTHHTQNSKLLTHSTTRGPEFLTALARSLPARVHAPDEGRAIMRTGRQARRTYNAVQENGSSRISEKPDGCIRCSKGFRLRFLAFASSTTRLLSLPMWSCEVPLQPSSLEETQSPYRGRAVGVLQPTSLYVYI